LIPASRNFHEPPEKLKLINRAEFFQLGRFSLFSLVLPVTFRAASYANLAAHLRKIPLHIRADKHARELLSTSTTAGGKGNNPFALLPHTHRNTHFRRRQSFLWRL